MKLGIGLVSLRFTSLKIEFPQFNYNILKIVKIDYLFPFAGAIMQ
jgi:hypothetical protein